MQTIQRFQQFSVQSEGTVNALLPQDDIRTRLTNAGCPIDPLIARVPYANYSGKVELRQAGPVEVAGLLELYPDWFACIIDVQILTCLRSSLLVGWWELVFPWPNSHFRWIDDPSSDGTENVQYVVPSTQISFPRRCVLNHLDRYPAVGSTKGILLGLYDGLVPKQYMHGRTVAAELKLHDYFDRPVVATPISLWVDRGTVRKPKGVPREIAKRGSLLSRRDREPIGGYERK